MNLLPFHSSSLSEPALKEDPVTTPSSLRSLLSSATLIGAFEPMKLIPLVSGMVRSDSADTAPVGNYPSGASWCEAPDLAGNVWEWMADRFGNYTSGRQVNPTGPSSGASHALRGDAADGTRAVSRAAARHGMIPSRAYKYTGFRCVRSADAP